MAYLTNAYLTSALGTTKVAKLAPGGTGPDVASLIDQAEAEVEGALMLGGYTGAYPSTNYNATAIDCPRLIKLAAFGAWLELAYGANDLELPEEYGAYVKKIEEIRAGKLEIPGVAAKSVARSIGGIQTTETNPSVSGARPAVFSRSRKDGSNPMGGY